MVRDEDFGEVPNLGPARDAMDEPPRRSEPPKRKPVPEAPRSPTPQASRSAPPEVRHRGNGFIYLLLLLIMIAAAGYGYWSFERQNRLLAELQVAGEKIAALENLISETDESTSKSGAALQAQLKGMLQEQDGRIKHVDSEIAKLWTVAHQRNRPKLEELEKRSDGVDQRLKTMDATMAQLSQDAKASAKVVADAGAAINRLTSGQTQQQEESRKLADQLRIRDQANQELDELQDQQLKQLSRDLAALKQTPQLPPAAAQQLQEHERSLESINAFRKQINQEVLRLRERVNSLQLQAPNKPTP